MEITWYPENTRNSPGSDPDSGDGVVMLSLGKVGDIESSMKSGHHREICGVRLAGTRRTPKIAPIPLADEKSPPSMRLQVVANPYSQW